MAMEEIVVKGKKTRGGVGLTSFIRSRAIAAGQSQQFTGGPGSGKTLAAGSLYAAEKKVMEEIVVKAKKTATKTLPKVAPLADLFTPEPKYLPVLYKPPVMPEIIVTAKRLPKVVSLLSRASLPLTLAEVGGYLTRNILREAGRQAFEELGEKVTRTIPARPDTPVKTIQETATVEALPEVIVTAQRRPRAQNLTQFWTETQQYSDLSDLFYRDMLTDSYTSPVFSDLAVATPTVPQVQTQTQTQTQTQLATQALTGTRTGTALRRSELLGIGTGTASSVATMTNTVVATMPITQSQLAITTKVGQKTKYCKPCPDPRKKKRSKCYRQLVKQGLTPARDKVSKWAQIDCVTGKTIKEMI